MQQTKLREPIVITMLWILSIVIPFFIEYSFFERFCFSISVVGLIIVVSHRDNYFATKDMRAYIELELNKKREQQQKLEREIIILKNELSKYPM